jgi:tetratricopeptide (TPR) repeat protein
MSFRFPISPNLSITAQPIARLIRADLPASHEERLQLFAAVLDKYHSVREGHEAARRAAVESQQGGPGFVLFLRNFASEQLADAAAGIERIHDFYTAALVQGVRSEVQAAGLAMLSLRGGNDVLDELLGYGLPVFTGQLGNWRAIASELIDAAAAIVIVASELTPGLREEIELIQARARTGVTIVFVCARRTTLKQLLSDAPDPAALAALRAAFGAFEHVHGPPPRVGWRPKQDLAPELRDWSGFGALRALLAHARPGSSELAAVRAAVCQVLTPGELDTPDHAEADRALRAMLRQVQQTLASGRHEPEPEHLTLRLAHAAFGIAVALEASVAMVESLAAVAEVYTTLEDEVMLGFIHAGHALTLLPALGAGGWVEGLVPKEGALGSLARERIGVAHYAVGRLHRATGAHEEAKAAYLAALRVLEPVSTPVAERAMAATLHSLAGLLHAHNHHAEARPLAERAVTLFEQVDADQPSERLGAAHHNLGSILTSLGELQAASAALDRSLRVKKLALGGVRHVSVAETAVLMGTIASQAGGEDDAMRLFEFARDVLQEQAPGHPLLRALDKLMDAQPDAPQ